MMKNEEEKRCPLCAEEMDWTDQQFKPCKCGYQICVWCWHHIIETAEKEDMEGRCPACRSTYEKDRIVAMQANLERTLTKDTNKKTKQSKSKSKADEGKKDLTNIRVIQRKMAYVIGLPLSLADEDVLVRKDYFGQYGKVTKICLSRSAGGVIQQFINDTCSVYVTYSREEEALRCIQAVHGFVLHGRHLRASFGTAKYCHAWLKNMPCNNPTCLYLHSIGADEDSFGKDEAAAVQTRTRVHQIVGSANNAIERSGNVLPPPEEDVCSNTSGFTEKPSVRNVVSESTHGSVNSSNDSKSTFIFAKEKEGCVTIPHRLGTFVDIVGRSSTSWKDGNWSEEKRISDLSSELSFIKISGDAPPGDPYSYPSLPKDSSSNSIGNEIYQNFLDKSPSNVSLLFDDQGSNHASVLNQKPFSPHPNRQFTTSESSAFLHEKNRAMDDFSLYNNSVHIHEGEASLPLRRANSALNSSFQEMMHFQNSAKSDRIYRNSRSFSNEEIVEHLRRLDDGLLTSDEDRSAFDALEKNIVANILSLDFDSGDDILGMPSVFSNGVSGNSLTCDLLGYPFVIPDGFANQIAGSVIPDCGDKEQYLCKSQNPARGPQSLASTGFKFPPPGFSTCDRTTPPSSGYQLNNAASPLPNTKLQQPATASPFSGSADCINNRSDPAMSSCAESKFQQLDEETRRRFLMQESAQIEALQNSSFMQQKRGFDSSHCTRNGVSEANGGWSSRAADRFQNYNAAAAASSFNVKENWGA